MSRLKRAVKRVPILRHLVRIAYYSLINRFRAFSGSEEYWKQRYKAGNNSGVGSYGELAEFKAEYLNALVAERGVASVIEYGCGDGNQLKLAKYPKYIGFDVSHDAIEMCKEAFADDPTKTFKLMDQYSGERAELTLSLDVIYHLTEEEVFVSYMERLFDSSDGLVAIYSSNSDRQRIAQAPHVRHREFTRWVSSARREWQLVKRMPNRYPYKNEWEPGSFADFYLFAKIDSSTNVK